MRTMLSHLPVNHPLRPLYRIMVGIIGGYSLLFGIVGVTQTRGTALFAQAHLPWVLGLRTNPAFAFLSVVSGAILLIAAAIGRNVGALVYLVGGLIFMTVGVLELALLQTDVNVLGFTMTTCIVSFVFGSVALAAGLYGRVGAAHGVHRQA
jgi:uncharacterized protein DUF4383